ncbi:MAG TPA: serine/threonine-protein kinase [Planctomycetaceae bacterium]|nr:serine/threonine-protein kinase [Planctomycetaceae bacterium]
MSSSNSQKPDSGKQKIPKQLGKYQLVRKLGSGGMGTVFLAKDEKTNRMVALKLLPISSTFNETLIQRFRAEAMSASKLEHENIVRVYEADEIDDFLYIALEYIDGTDVDKLIQSRERLPVKRASEIIKQVASALQHAYDQNIIHRDIKPSNLMIRKDGVIKVTDLGLARSVDESLDTSITREGTTVGTVDYMAPEQARNSRDADIRSDLYSLGCTWYQMLVGHVPYYEGSVTNKLRAHAAGPIPNPRDENPEIPESIANMIMRLMAKDKENRYQTPQELLDDLANVNFHRPQVSQDVMAALAHSEGDSHAGLAQAPNYSGTRSDLPAKTRPLAASPQQKLPPKVNATKQKSGAKDQAQETGGKLEPLKYLAAAAGVIAVLLLIVYIARSLASGIDPGEMKLSDESLRERERKLLESQQTGSGKATDGLPVNQAAGEKEKQAEPEQKKPLAANLQNSNAPNRQRGPRSSVPLLLGKNDKPLPDWAFEIPSAKEAGQMDLGWKPQLRTVGVWKSRSGEFDTLEEALKDLPPGACHLQLLGPGPFVLPASELSGKQLMITGFDDQQPVILLRADRDQPSETLWRLKGCSLLMSGVHLVAVGHQLPPGSQSKLNLLHLSDGNLYFRNCSISLLGETAHSVTAIHLSGNGESGHVPRVLLDRTTVRGNLTTLSQDRASFETVITNSLLLSGSAPTFRLTGTMGGPKTTTKLAEDSRSLRLVRSTLVSNHSILRIDPGADSSNPAPVFIQTDSTILAARGEHNRPLLELVDWPMHPSPQSTDVAAINLRWEQDELKVLGWKRLIETGRSSAKPVETKEDWFRFWSLTPTPRFQYSNHWPESAKSDGIALIPDEWSVSALSRTESALASENVGCPTDQLSQPVTNAVRDAQGFARLRTEQVPALTISKTVNIDLSRVDLAEELRKTDWESGTRFVLSGKSIRAQSPIVVEGKSLTLEFAEGVDKSFVLEPHPREPGEAMISVRNGSLRLKNIHLALPNRTKEPLPNWAVSVEHGSLFVEGCELLGCTVENESYRGLIRWETAGTQSRSTSPSSLHGHVLKIESTFMHTGETALELHPGGSLVSLKNCLITSTGPALLLELSNAEPTTFDVGSSTFASSEAIVQIANAPAESDSPAGYFFWRNNVIAPPFPAAQEAPRATFLAADRNWSDPNNLFWWEKSNGYSPLLSCYFRDPERGSPAQDFAKDWMHVWGENRIRKALTGPEGVIMKSGYPERGKIAVSNFLLDEKSRAHSMLPGPLGIDPNTFGLAAKESKSVKPPVKPAPGKVGGF